MHLFCCPQCGAITFSYGDPVVECCGHRLSPLPILQNAPAPTVVETDGEYLLEYPSPMTKEDYIAAVLVERYDRMELVRLFPEQAAQVRISQLQGTQLHTLYNRHGSLSVETCRPQPLDPLPSPAR